MEMEIFSHEGKEFKIVKRSWEEIHGITAIVMTLNEERNIEEFLKHVKPHVKKIVMIDGGSVDKTVLLALPLVDALQINPWVGHYANQRNHMMELVRTDWTLLLDPDERHTDKLWKKIPELIEQEKYDCWEFPRREFHDGKEVPDVYPDFQKRLFRTYCRFIRPSHCEVVGFKNCGTIEKDRGMDILHKKLQKRHDSRNTAYWAWDTNYKYELGCPGQQTEKTFGGR